jgi:hypothetical protein
MNCMVLAGNYLDCEVPGRGRRSGRRSAAELSPEGVREVAHRGERGRLLAAGARAGQLWSTDGGGLGRGSIIAADARSNGLHSSKGWTDGISFTVHPPGSRARVRARRVGGAPPPPASNDSVCGPRWTAWRRWRTRQLPAAVAIHNRSRNLQELVPSSLPAMSRFRQISAAVLHSRHTCFPEFGMAPTPSPTSLSRRSTSALAAPGMSDDRQRA